MPWPCGVVSVLDQCPRGRVGGFWIARLGRGGHHRPSSLAIDKPPPAPAGPDQSPDLPLARSRTALVLWLALGGVAAALFCTPWKAEMLRWLIVSVLWMRPEIQEWNPTPLGWDHTAFFVLIVLGILAWTCSRRQRAWWELAACAAFALLGLRSVRNAPLFSLVALALAPPHLADVLARFRRFFARWEMRASNPALRDAAGALCAAGMVGVAVSMFTLHKEHPLTMEAPRSRYPVGAVDFLLNNQLRGRMLAFFRLGGDGHFRGPRVFAIHGRAVG